MNTTVEINNEALEREAKRIADMTSEDVQATLHKALRAVLERVPVKITAFDPLNDNAATPVVETISKRDLAAIYAVINFAAHHLNARPETIQTRVETKFHVPHVARIPREAFQKAVDYLVDMAECFDEETD